MNLKNILYKSSLGGLVLALGIPSQPSTKLQELSDLLRPKNVEAQTMNNPVDYEALAKKAEGMDKRIHYKDVLDMLRPYEDDPRNKSSNFFNELGIAYSLRGRQLDNAVPHDDFQAAEKAYLRAIELEPLSPHERVNLGILYLKYLKDRQKAEEQFRFVIQKIDNDNKPANFYLKAMKEGRF